MTSVSAQRSSASTSTSTSTPSQTSESAVAQTPVGRYRPPHARQTPTTTPARNPSDQRYHSSATPSSRFSTPAPITPQVWKSSASSSRTYPNSGGGPSGSNGPGAGPGRSGQYYPQQDHRSSPRPKTWNESRKKPLIHLHIYGDSFLGPLTLVPEGIFTTKFKGGSAKGLNNPHSVKGNGPVLHNHLDDWLNPSDTSAWNSPAESDYALKRYAMFMFGNVDFHVNYLYQMLNRPIVAESFTSAELPIFFADGDIIPPIPQTEIAGTASTSSHDGDILPPAGQAALGPAKFIEKIFKNYTQWLMVNVVNGPLGKRLRSQAARPRDSPVKYQKLLLAAVLPPLILDEHLYRIPGKYVERLEQAAAQEASEKANGSRGVKDQEWRQAPGAPNSNSNTNSRWTGSRPSASASDHEPDMSPMGALIQKAAKMSINAPPLQTAQRYAALASTDVDDSPSSASSSPKSKSSSHLSTSSRSTTLTTPELDAEAKRKAENDRKDEVYRKQIAGVFAKYPGLINLKGRIQMVDRYNALLESFCADNSDYFTYISINEVMRQQAKERGYVAQYGEVDQAIFADPEDVSNIHPHFENTVMLWADQLRAVGVPVVPLDPEELARSAAKFEAEKAERVARNGVYAD